VSTDWEAEAASKPASEERVSTDSAAAITAAPSHAPAASACEPHRKTIAAALRGGRNAKPICQDL
jgi:hypothetical protein